MEAERPHPLTQALAACRRVLVVVALFSACVNLLMLTVPMYMLQVYDRVLTTGNVDTLLALSAMAVVALATFGLLDAVRLRILARAGVWLDRELGSPVLAGAVADARRSGGAVSAQGLRDLSTLRGYLGGAGIMPLLDAPWSPVFLAIVFVIHPLLGCIGLAGAVLLFGLAVLNGRVTRRKLMEANEASVRALNAADAAVRNADGHHRHGHAAGAGAAVARHDRRRPRHADGGKRRVGRHRRRRQVHPALPAGVDARRRQLSGDRQPDVRRQHHRVRDRARARSLPGGAVEHGVARLPWRPERVRPPREAARTGAGRRGEHGPAAA